MLLQTCHNSISAQYIILFIKYICGIIYAPVDTSSITEPDYLPFAQCSEIAPLDSVCVTALKRVQRITFNAMFEQAIADYFFFI